MKKSKTNAIVILLVKFVIANIILSLVYIYIQSPGFEGINIGLAITNSLKLVTTIFISHYIYAFIKCFVNITLYNKKIVSLINKQNLTTALELIEIELNKPKSLISKDFLYINKSV